MEASQTKYGYSKDNSSYFIELPFEPESKVWYSQDGGANFHEGQLIGRCKNGKYIVATFNIPHEMDGLVFVEEVYDIEGAKAMHEAFCERHGILE